MPPKKSLDDRGLICPRPVDPINAEGPFEFVIQLWL